MVHHWYDVRQSRGSNGINGMEWKAICGFMPEFLLRAGNQTQICTGLINNSCRW